MSSTGRGTERDPTDFYSTPRPAFTPLLPYLPFSTNIWEPMCGDRRLISWGREHGLTIDGADLHRGDNRMDFLADATPRDYIITNPSFGIAEATMRHALTVAPDVMLLLRLNFLASEERYEWFNLHEPNALFILSKRPGFVMSCTCRACKNNWILPLESERPKACPVCSAPKPKISTSDSCDYAWHLMSRPPAGCPVLDL